MRVQLEEPVQGVPQDAIVLGTSTWSDQDRSLKYAWPDKNGKRARGGEIPISAVPQAVLFAARAGYLTREQMATITQGLVDVLAQ